MIYDLSSDHANLLGQAWFVVAQVTQVDLVQTQIRIAAGATLKELGLVQKNVKVAGVAMQCRVTTEDPSQVRHQCENFRTRSHTCFRYQALFRSHTR